MRMVACVALQIVPMGTVGIVREPLGSLGDLRQIPVAPDACTRTFRAHGRHALVALGAAHAGARMLVGQQVRPRDRWDDESRWREQHEEQEKG